MPSSAGLTLVFMGDSITEGQYVDPSLRWTELVMARIRRDFAAAGAAEFELVNKGISGETTRQGLERFPRDVQAFRPAVMTLQFGLNDCNCWDTDEGLPRVSAVAYRANLLEMIERGRRFGAREIVLSTNHVTLRRRKLASGQTLEERRVRYNEIVREVARTTNVTLCDVETTFNEFDDATLARMLLPEPDVLHLSQAGHVVYADCVYPYVDAAIRRTLQR